MSYQDQPCNIMGCLPMGASLEPGNLISFSIGVTTYQAMGGMTFSQWVSSAYNTDGFTLGTNSVIQNDSYVALQSEEFARPSDVIVSGYTYKIREAYITFYMPDVIWITITPHGLWEGVLQYSEDAQTWNNITAETEFSVGKTLHLRGINNTVVTGYTETQNWYYNAGYVSPARSNYIIGNFETLLNYSAVLNGTHPTVGERAFNTMFYNWSNSNLKWDVSDVVLPFNTAPYSSYAMFAYANIISSPKMPATTMSDYCYGSALRSTNITTAPDLPATVLSSNCYRAMFRDCTALTATPSLSATSVGDYCCRQMFRGCTSLNTITSLPATTLSSGCYQEMFYGCSNIKLSTSQTGAYQTAYRIPTIGTGTDDGDALSEMFTNTGGTFTGTPSINTTYYTSNSIL